MSTTGKAAAQGKGAEDKGKKDTTGKPGTEAGGRQEEASTEVAITAQYDPAMSERFTNAVIREFSAIMGAQTANLDAGQKRLAQHLFAKMNATLVELEKKRLDKGQKDKAQIVWANVNMQKLALDAVHRIELGLDALIPNHIWPIPYWNERSKKYDVDLRIGYVGKDYYRRKMAIAAPKDIRYELVYTTDKLTVFMKSKINPIETYEFDIPEPFNRGEVKGGFAYLEYEDTSKNKLVLISLAEFNKSKALAQSQDFWSKYPEKMQYKTLVLRATDKLQIDPEKVNASFLAVENDDISDAREVREQIAGKANAGEVIDIQMDHIDESTGEVTSGHAAAQDAAQTQPVCTCDEMIKEGVKAFDCPRHGRYQDGRFTPPPQVQGQPDKRKPEY